MDTHLLAEACRQERDGESGPELAFVHEIIAVCPIINLSSTQDRGELVPALGRRGFRLVAQATLLSNLQSKGKLLQLPANRHASMTPSAMNAFRGKGHRNIYDDLHLYSAAMVLDRLVVTRDEHLLSARDAILHGCGVDTCAPEELNVHRSR